MAFILIGFIFSFVILAWVGRGGAISYEAAEPAIKKLLAHYVPLLAILAGFYFSERAIDARENQTSLETFVFAVIVVGLWVLIPPLLIAFSTTIEAALRFLDSVGVFGTSLGSACLAFYFSKSAKLRKNA